MSGLLARANVALRRRPRTPPAVLAPVCLVVGGLAGVVVGALTLR
ncbi:hypothetical protein [Luteimicrobium sp. DT211]